MCELSECPISDEADCCPVADRFQGFSVYYPAMARSLGLLALF